MTRSTKIVDTTREERIQIVAEALRVLGDDWVGTARLTLAASDKYSPATCIIDGELELAELNMARASTAPMYLATQHRGSAAPAASCRATGIAAWAWRTRRSNGGAHAWSRIAARVADKDGQYRASSTRDGGKPRQTPQPCWACGVCCADSLGRSPALKRARRVSRRIAPPLVRGIPCARLRAQRDARG